MEHFSLLSTHRQTFWVSSYILLLKTASMLWSIAPLLGAPLLQVVLYTLRENIQIN